MSVASLGRRICLLAAFAFALPLAAQTGSITGKVTDSLSGKPLIGVQVVARLATGGGGGSATTNEAGTYRIANLAAGTYTVTALHIGNARVTATDIRVGAAVATVNLAMAQINMLNQVVVTETRGAAAQKVLEAPAAVSVVAEQEIALRPSLTTTDHLKATPGIDISQGGLVQSNVTARGFNNIFSGALLMLQDYRFAGVPSLRVNVPALFTGSNEDVERIEVLLGPASALYGPNSGSGVLHVITKSPFNSEGTTLTLDGGSHSVIRASGRYATVLGTKVGVKVSGEYMRGKDFEYHDPAEPATFPASAPAGRAGMPNERNFDIERMTAEARLDYRLDDKTEAVTTIGFTKLLSGIELTGANGAAYGHNWTYMNLQERFRRGRFFAQAFTNMSNAGNDTSTSLTGTYLLRSGQPIVDKSRVFVGQVQHGFNLGKTSLTYGADYVYTNPRTGNTINGANENIDNVVEYGAYVQGTIPLKPKWDFVGAVRVDKNDQITGSQFSPRAALVFKPSQTQNLRATFNRAFSTPANFAFFLDLIQAVNAGGSGFNVRAVGNHGGHPYDRSCTGAAYGSFCMRSIYTGPGAASAARAFTGLVTAQQSALISSITAGLTPSLGAGAAGMAQAIVNGLKNANPTDAQLQTRAATLTNGTVDIAATSLKDVAPLKAGYDNTYELGYKGMLGNKGRLSVDFWYQERGDVNPPAALATPSVFFVGTNLGQFLGSNIGATVTQALMAQGMPQAQAQATAAAIAGSLAPSIAGNLARAPLGTVTFQGEERPDVLYTYTSVSDSIVKVMGIDVGYDWIFNDAWALNGTISWQNKNVFDNVAFSATEGGNGKPYMSNSPKAKTSLAIRYDNRQRGMGFELRGRYADAFPVNSGVFVSGLDLKDPAGNTFHYDPVPVNATVDVGFNWHLPISGRNITWSLNGTNVLDNKVATFVGVPKIGALWLTRLSYKF